MRCINHPDAVHVHDDLLRYMGDTLSWMVCYNPGPTGMPQCAGLNWEGPTIIRRDGAEAMMHVFDSWASLLAGGPRMLQLTGPYTYFSGDEAASILRPSPPQPKSRAGTAPRAHPASAPSADACNDERPSAAYRVLEFDRDATVKTLRTLASYAKQVLQGDGDAYILHLGL